MRNWYLLVITFLLAGCSLATKVPPVANAGPDVTVHIGQPIFLDGSLSYDPDGGRIVRYDWQIVGTPEGREERRGEMLIEGNQEPVWIAREEDLGQWIIRLQATDDEGDIATDDLVVTIIQ
ncbi:MAG: hypothetical protein ACE5LG_04510 [Anaerolineae bacterium]